MTSEHINAHGAAHSKYTDDSQGIEEGRVLLTRRGSAEPGSGFVERGPLQLSGMRSRLAISRGGVEG